MIRMIKILDMRVPTWQKSRWVGEADCEIHALTGKQQIVTWEPTFVWRERCFVCCQYSRQPAIIQYTAPPAHLPWQAYITKNVLCDFTADYTFKLMQVWFDLARYNYNVGTAEMHREEKRCCKYTPGGQIYTPGGHLRVAKASGDRRRKPARPRCKVNADHHQWQCNTKVSSKGTTRAISWLL